LKNWRASFADVGAHRVRELRVDGVLVCSVCAPQTAGAAPIDEAHWFCLREAAWSEVPAVQVASLRLLKRLDADWARELDALEHVG
jgi:hypothetical protein